MSENGVPPGLRITSSTNDSGAGSVPPGFDKNPTAWPRRIVLAILAFAGFCVSVYLALFQVEVLQSVWDPFFQSPKVLKYLGIPDAALGAMAYGTEVVLTFIGGRSRWRTAPWTVLAFGFVIVNGLLVSILLILMQAFLVGAWCTLCLTSAAISIAIFALGVEEPWAGIKHLKRVRDEGGDVWKALWGLEDTDKKGRD
ncbi:MAG: vitamin K epoxide reductase family protein [Rubrobacteraceae bacterium]